MPDILNQQSALAHRFSQLDNYILQLSKLAYIKAQCLQITQNKTAMTEIINDTLLTCVSNQFVLDKSGFYYGQLEN
jgi:hypothetical protein